MTALQQNLSAFALNAIWQISVVAIVVAILDFLMRRAGASRRAAFWTGGVLAASILPWIPARQFLAPDFAAPIVIRSNVVAEATAPSVVLWPAVAVVALAAWRLARLAWGLTRLRKIRRGAFAVDEVLVSSAIAAPLTFGVLRPVIVVPEVFWNTAPANVKRSVIEHERIHVTRRDYAWNLAVEIATLAVWWHPAVEWMRRRLARVREFACDEAASSRVPGYASSIVEAARIIVERQSPQCALGFFDSTNLEERMMKLIHPSPRFTPRLAKLSLAGAFFALIVSAGALAMRPVAFALQENQPAASDGTIYKIGGDVLPPKLIDKREPEYTESARDAKIEGTVILKAIISAEGRVERADVVQSLEPGLDANAIKAISTWKFQPATKGGTRVRVAATIEVNYRLV